MKKFLVLAITMATLAWSTPAKAAEPILFNPDGVVGGVGTAPILTFDWSVGNSLLVESLAPVPGTAANGFVGTPGHGTVYFQANLANAFLQTSDPAVFANGTGGNYFTAVAGYEIIIDQTVLPGPGGTTVSNFTLDLSGTPVNFFNIYHNTVGASDLTGHCFVCGDLVLSAKAFDDSFVGFNSSFTVPVAAAQIAAGGVDLDQFNGDSYPTVNTLTGSGSTNIKVKVESFNANYFPSLQLGTTFVTTNSSQINPYDQTDPSGCFDSNGLIDLGNADADCIDFSEELGATSVGALNGTTNRIITQTDANSSFIAPTIVPEPTTLSLLGLGLLVGGAHLRRRAKKNA